MTEEQQPLDHLEENDKKGDVIDNIKSYSTWKRFLYMLIFLLIFTLTEPIVYVVMSFNFLILLIVSVDIFLLIDVSFSSFLIAVNAKGIRSSFFAKRSF